MDNVNDIRTQLITKYQNEDFSLDKTGVKTIELIGATFLANEPYILREANAEYIERELDWYKSQSLYVDDIPGTTPAIWKQIASTEGKINSNYGWCIWSQKNNYQFDNVLETLIKDPDSRRAVMIYNRPSMHSDYNKDGMSDFVCTYANTFYIRDDKLISHYLMRSNDAVFGYNNDYAWAKYVQDLLCFELKTFFPKLEVGDLIWTASNLHVYERHFNYLEK